MSDAASVAEQARDDAKYLRSFHDEATWWPIADRIEVLVNALETAVKFARPIDIQAAHVQGGVDILAVLGADRG